MSGRTIAIGDIHGCSRALSRLIEEIVPTREDVIIPLGDYVDRGPDSRGVLDQLIGLSERCELQPLLGNHEEMFLSVIVDKAPPQGWLQYGGTATLDSYGFSGDLEVIPREHIEFIRSCHDYFETKKHFFVHANYVPELPLAEQSARTIRWKSLREQIPGPHRSGKVAVVGHTADKAGEIFKLKHLICLDTYCYGGGWLTAMDVEAGTVWQANQEGELRS
jgi:serine/threonine protein phosphatase 1